MSVILRGWVTTTQWACVHHAQYLCTVTKCWTTWYLCLVTPCKKKDAALIISDKSTNNRIWITNIFFNHGFSDSFHALWQQQWWTLKEFGAELYGLINALMQSNMLKELNSHKSIYFCLWHTCKNLSGCIWIQFKTWLYHWKNAVRIHKTWVSVDK